MPNPFDGHNAALATATKTLDITNARALIDWVDNAPGAAEQQAAMWTVSARRISEKILVADQFAEALHDFAATQARQAERIREVGQTFRRAHAEELRRINEPKLGEDKWDISKNRTGACTTGTTVHTPVPTAPAERASEPGATYTSPEVCLEEFDDYRPGKGLASVNDTLDHLRRAYQLSDVRAVTTPTGVRFEATGPYDSLQAFADLYGDRPSRLPQGELTVVKKLTVGEVAETVELVRDANGRKAVRKTFPTQEAHRADREVAAAAVARAVGIDDFEVRREGPGTVIMTYFDGKTGTDVATAGMSPEDVLLLDDSLATDELINDPVWMAKWEKANEQYQQGLKDWSRAPGSKEIALLDYLAANLDRNSGNWIVDADGVIHPIDHDGTFSGHIQQVRDRMISLDSPFSGAWLAKDGVASWCHNRPERVLRSSFTKDELEQVMDRLEVAKAELDKIPPTGRSSVYDLTRQRLQWLIEACA